MADELKTPELEIDKGSVANIKKIIKQQMDAANVSGIDQANVKMKIKNQLAGLIASYDIEPLIYALIDHIGEKAAEPESSSRYVDLNKKFQKVKEELGLNTGVITGPSPAAVDATGAPTGGVLGKDNYMIPIKLGKVQKRASLEQPLTKGLNI